MELSIENKVGSIILRKKLQTGFTEVLSQGSCNQILPLLFTHPAPGTPECEFHILQYFMCLTRLGNEKKKGAQRHELTVLKLETTNTSLRSSFYFTLLSFLFKRPALLLLLLFFTHKRVLFCFLWALLLRYFNHCCCYPLSSLLLRRHNEARISMSTSF